MAINFPVPTFIGQQYTPPGSTITYQWDGTCWNIVPQMGPMYIGDTPPPNPAVGQKWWRSTNGQEYLWYDDGTSKQWVQSAGAAGMPGLWEPIGGQNGNGIHTFNAAYYEVKDLAAFKKLRWAGTVAISVTGGLALRVSNDNGASYISGANDYGLQYNQSSQTTNSPNQVASSVAYITNSTPDANGIINFTGHFEEFNNPSPAPKGLLNTCKFRASTTLALLTGLNSFAGNGVYNAIRFLPVNAGILNGSLTLEGVRG